MAHARAEARHFFPRFSEFGVFHHRFVDVRDLSDVMEVGHRLYLESRHLRMRERKRALFFVVVFKGTLFYFPAIFFTVPCHHFDVHSHRLFTVFFPITCLKNNILLLKNKIVIVLDQNPKGFW